MNLNLFILILNTIQCIFITDTWAANAKPAVTQKSYFNRVTYPNRLIRTPNSRYSKIKPYIIASNGRKKDSFVQRTSAHLESLLKSIRLGQEKQSTEYTPTITYPPLLHWHQQRGIYKSSVHLNFHGDESKTALRNIFQFPDSNGFVSMFVLDALIQIAQLDPSLKPSESELMVALKAISTHKDLNNPNLPIYSFWNQVPNGKGNYHCSVPNIEVPLASGFNLVSLFSKKLSQFQQNDLAAKLDSFVNIGRGVSKLFRIPPDADDTGCNLALGSRLNSAKVLFPRAFQFWKKHTSITAEIFDYYDEFTYQPFSDDKESNLIDPRTFVWIRSYLYKLQQEKSDLDLSSTRFITTWFQHSSNVHKEQHYQKMPFNINNVDATVVANGLFGLFNTLKDMSFPSEIIFEHQGLFIDNIKLLNWVLQSDIIEEYSTSVLLYYPSKYAFFWFVSRLVQLFVESASYIDELKFPDLFLAMNELIETAQTKMTVKLLDLGVEEHGFLFWDDFLGNGDTCNGKACSHHEDRVFSTAMALNALIDTWVSKHDNYSQLKYHSNVPHEVRVAIEQSSNWLRSQSHKYSKKNAFFSASVKGPNHNPFNFPHNSFKSTNPEFNSVIKPGSHYLSTEAFGYSKMSSLQVAVEGVISNEEYNYLNVNQHVFGKKVSESFARVPFNGEDAIFPYWSSDVLTDSIQLLALVKVENLGR